MITDTEGRHRQHTWDFYKPRPNSDYPVVDGPLSNVCYLSALQMSYERWSHKHAENHSSETNQGLDSVQYICMHSPYNKITRKALVQMHLTDLKRQNVKTDSLVQFAKESMEAQLANTQMMGQLVKSTETLYSAKCLPSSYFSVQLGNTYTASLYMGLASLFADPSTELPKNSRIGMYSYGSGFIASFFTIRVKGSLHIMRKVMEDAKHILDKERIEIDARTFQELMREKEDDYARLKTIPVGDEELWHESWRIKAREENWKVSYRTTDP